MGCFLHSVSLLFPLFIVLSILQSHLVPCPELMSVYNILALWIHLTRLIDWTSVSCSFGRDRWMRRWADKEGFFPFFPNLISNSVLREKKQQQITLMWIEDDNMMRKIWPCLSPLCQARSQTHWNHPAGSISFTALNYILIKMLPGGNPLDKLTGLTSAIFHYLDRAGYGSIFLIILFHLTLLCITVLLGSNIV